MLYKIIILALTFTIASCASPVPEIKINQCYISNYAAELGPKHEFYEIQKVETVTATKVRCLYTFPNDPNFKGKWAKGIIPYLLSTYDKDYFLAYYKPIVCPY